MIKVSVIVPVFGVEPYLRECIDSILNQTLKEIEIILMSGKGSPDDCEKICDEYGNLDSRVIVVHNEKKDVVEARAVGSRLAQGEYIIAIDGDDHIENNMIEEMYSAAKNHNADVVVCDYYEAHSDGQVFIRRQGFDQKLYNLHEDLSQSGGEVLNNLFIGNGKRVLPQIWTKLFKRELVLDNLKYGRDDAQIGEDYIFTYTTILSAKNIFFINKPLYHYRFVKHKSSINMINSFVNVDTALREALKDKGMLRLIPQLDLRFYDQVFVSIYCDREYCNSKNNKERANRIREILNIPDVKKRLKRVKYKGMGWKTKVLLFAFKHNIASIVNYVAKRVLNSIEVETA